MSNRHSRRQLRKLREHMVSALHPDERLFAEGLARDPQLAADTYVVVTEARFLVGYVRDPDILVCGLFEHVGEVAERPGALKITTSQETPLFAMPSQANPRNELDFFIEYGSDATLRSALLAGVGRLAPGWRLPSGAKDRYDRAKVRPLNEWQVCPVCEVPLTDSVEGAVRCGQCGRYFADPYQQPLVSDEAEAYGTLLGVVTRWPLATETEVAGFVRPFILRPRHYTTGPLVVIDPDLEPLNPAAP